MNLEEITLREVRKIQPWFKVTIQEFPPLNFNLLPPPLGTQVVKKIAIICGRTKQFVKSKFDRQKTPKEH